MKVETGVLGIGLPKRHGKRLQEDVLMFLAAS
jgi:hypothetical protein